MKQTITQSDFIGAFGAMGRAENFSYDARAMLFDHFEECDPDMELDVIAICCEYAEADADEIIADYDIEIEADASDEDKLESVREFLADQTSVVGEIDAGNFVYAQF